MSYVGSHGFNLTFPTNINAVPLNQLSSSDTSDCGTGSTVNCAVPYPIYQQINGNLYQAISNYNALQMTITKRMQHGFSYSANYTWSHFLDDQDSSGWGTHAGPTTLSIRKHLDRELRIEELWKFELRCPQFLQRVCGLSTSLRQRQGVPE